MDECKLWHSVDLDTKEIYEFSADGYEAAKSFFSRNKPDIKNHVIYCAEDEDESETDVDNKTEELTEEMAPTISELEQIFSDIKTTISDISPELELMINEKNVITFSDFINTEVIVSNMKLEHNLKVSLKYKDGISKTKSFHYHGDFIIDIDLLIDYITDLCRYYNRTKNMN